MFVKKGITLCVIGHVDAGKSTLSGQLLFQNNGIEARKLDKLKEKAEAMGRGSFFLAHTTDTNKEEQERGITISSTIKEFTCKKSGRKVTLTDAPGHRQFINNMVSGAAQCNYAILVVSAKENEKAAGLAESGQTMEHVMIVQALGIKKLIIAVNKMDDENINYSKDKYEETCAAVLKQYKNLPARIKLPTAVAKERCAARKKACEAAKKKVIYKFEDRYEVPIFCPVSGFTGCNIQEPATDKMPWYKGPCLMDLIDSLEDLKYDLSVPLRMMGTGLHNVKGVGKVFTGKVLSGQLRPGDKVVIQPGDVVAEVKTIEKFKKPCECADPSDSIGITLKGCKDEQISRLAKGCVMGADGTGLQRVWRVLVKITLTDNFRGDFHAGFKPSFLCGTQRKTVTVVEVISVKGPKSREFDEGRTSASAKDTVLCEIQTEKGELVFEEDSEKYSELVAFAVRNGSVTIGFGTVEKIENDKFIKNFRVDKRKKRDDDGEENKEDGKKKKKASN